MLNNKITNGVMVTKRKAAEKDCLRGSKWKQPRIVGSIQIHIVSSESKNLIREINYKKQLTGTN
jgi:hypothetical protein